MTFPIQFQIRKKIAMELFEIKITYEESEIRSGWSFKKKVIVVSIVVIVVVILIVFGVFAVQYLVLDNTSSSSTGATIISTSTASTPTASTSTTCSDGDCIENTIVP